MAVGVAAAQALAALEQEEATEKAVPPCRAGRLAAEAAKGWAASASAAVPGWRPGRKPASGRGYAARGLPSRSAARHPSRWLASVRPA